MNEEVSLIKNIINNFDVDKMAMKHDLYFNITNMCNLNCTNCALDCGRRTPFFVSFEDFKQQYTKINSIMEIRAVTLIGGEPLLHKNLLQMCDFIYKLSPDTHIIIMTNGILTNLLTDDDLKLLQIQRVEFVLTLYPKLDIIKKVKQFEERCKQFNIRFRVHGIRPCFGTFNFSPLPIHDKDEYFYLCEKSAFPHSFVTFDGRLYNCCLMPSFADMGIPTSEEDSIPINEIKDKQQLIELASHSYHGCAYCQDHEPIGEPLHFWHTQDEVPSCNVFSSLFDYYLDDYDYYYKLCHTYGEIKECLQDPYFLSKANFKDHLTSKPIKQYTKRFFNGVLDIFIPFDNNNYKTLLKLKDNLFNQTIADKVNYYFISCNANREVEAQMYCTFPPMTGDQISTLFLKAPNRQEAINILLENSFINNILILDEPTYPHLKDLNYFYSVVQGQTYLLRDDLLNKKYRDLPTFEVPYNFDKNLINIIKILDYNGDRIDCIYLCPRLQDYPSISRGIITMDTMEKLTKEEYESHIKHINDLFPGKIQLLLQKTNQVMEKPLLQYYINLGINKFCVGNIEQAKLIRELLPNADIIGSIAAHITEQEIVSNLNEYKKYYNGFVLDFSWGRKLNIIKTLPKDFRYVILANAKCNINCDGDHHWYYDYRKGEPFTCPGLYERDHTIWSQTTLIRPMDLHLWYPYISVFKLQDRGWPTDMIVNDFVIYTHHYMYYPNITYDENIYNEVEQ